MSVPPPLPYIAINLDARGDRWTQITSAFPNRAIERFSAIEMEDGEEACKQSHFAVIALARERNYPWVAILEDDCMPYPHFDTELDARILPYLWAHRTNWDIYNGGPGNAGSIRRSEHGFAHITEWISTHFIIINSSMYDTILNTYDITKCPKKIDAYYATFKTLSSYPLIAYQEPMYSDLAKSYQDNMENFSRMNAKLRAFS
jgi:hypothetical protein